MKTPMTEQIQAVIMAVQSYRKWLYDDAYAHSDFSTSNRRVESNTLDNHIKQTRDYFKSISSLEGMEHNEACFEAVLIYPVSKTLNTDIEDLPNEFEFGY